MRLSNGTTDARTSSSTAMQLIEDIIVVPGITAVVSSALSSGNLSSTEGHLVQGKDTFLTRGNDR